MADVARGRRGSGRIGGGKPAPIAPEDGEELVELAADDGWILRGAAREPPRGTSPVGVAIFAHAMYSRRAAFERPHGEGIARFFAARGWRTIAFDLRGHGASGPSAGEGGRWSYDDVVLRDLPSIVGAVRARSAKLPVVVVGHSLGGHAALAAHGVGATELDGVLAVAATPWHRPWDDSPARWAKRRLVVAASRAILERRGFFPARQLRQGSDDESYALFDAVLRVAEHGAWRSDDFRHDYAAALRRVRIPVVGLASDGDSLQAPPDCVARLIACCSGPHEMVRVRARDDGGPPPSHSGIVTDGSARAAWSRAESLLRERVSSRR